MKKLINLYILAAFIMLPNPRQHTLLATSETIDPNNIVDTIQDVAQIVADANDFIDQIIPDDNASSSGSQIINSISPEELAKWKYINAYFTTNLNDSSTPQKIAKFVNTYAKYLAAPTIAIYMALSNNLLDKVKSLITSTSTTTESESTVSKAVSSSLNLGSGSVKYIATPVVGALITYKTLKYVSSLIEKKSETYTNALIDFAKNWDTNKANTPEILCPLFDALNQNLTTNNGKLPKMDAFVAQEIVEMILSSSSVYASI